MQTKSNGVANGLPPPRIEQLLKWLGEITMLCYSQPLQAILFEQLFDLAKDLANQELEQLRHVRSLAIL